MEDYKYCPDCEKEYFSHIESCAYCEVKLLTKAQIKDLKSKEQYVSEGTSKDFVSIREGDKRWMEEIYNHLKNTGFNCQLIFSSGCSTKKCGDTFLVIVPSLDAEAADQCIEKYHHEVHPELKDSHEKSGQGMCPACGYEVGDASECTDCGLQLIFDESE